MNSTWKWGYTPQEAAEAAKRKEGKAAPVQAKTPPKK